ncbi:aminoglycoside phosphotransferase family protein [Spirilliplanes yamanashiensis]|uniref:aminoglycoside phosphotransferase family protein n=1 Tax=Spirilliplanes yamanashiensis TaxID=42233 RepID=UPI001EF20A65|nr:aminoglycoside phosphotransferase family protein [Spirilliplanes yamanashiensis]MDP9819297.1 aminoglycoside phosphotransferase (APT) family kinase protein [Spirilliplanes yamanashiensis]
MREIDAALVAELVREQFPRWGDLPVRAVARQGWDNRTFRLGGELAVRLPSGEGYVAAVAKEDRWLPVLAGRLPLPVPEPVGAGRPGAGYPFPWSVRRWLPGEPLDAAEGVDPAGVARDLGGFLTALRAAPAAGGPAAGRHCWFRGCHPSVYGDQVGRALDVLGDAVDAAACRAVWAAALTSAWAAAPVWFHGDVAPGNLLTVGGRLAAVIDFGTCGVGDPACDLVIAWTWLGPAERRVFRAAAGLDDDAWRRARGWALWKALATMAGLSGPDPAGHQAAVLRRVLADPVIG